MDSITFEIDAASAADVERALNEFGATAQPFVNDASQVTAEAIAREAAARLQRQLGPHATGKTVAGIHARPAHDGNGWIVIEERDPMPNLPFWLEKGTVHMKPRKHFYEAIALEVNAHQRRLGDALHEAARVTGMGD